MRTSTIELDRSETEGVILCLPVEAATDPHAMRWTCGHGYHLMYEDCFLCILEGNIRAMIEGAHEEPKGKAGPFGFATDWKAGFKSGSEMLELTTDCQRCNRRTYFVFPVGELLLCEDCYEGEQRDNPNPV